MTIDVERFTWQPEDIEVDASVSSKSSLKAISPRDRHEREMQAALQAVFDKIAPDIAAQIARGETPDAAVMEKALRDAVEVKLVEVFDDEVYRLGEDITIQFDPAVVNAEAVRWAKQYAFDLVKDLTDTTRGHLQDAIAKYQATPGMTRGALEKLLEADFGARRAEVISITEVTRSAQAATNFWQQELEGSGITMLRRWRTSQDELVCPQCGPLADKLETEWPQDVDRRGPPRHPRCRCTTTLEVAGGGAKSGTKHLQGQHDQQAHAHGGGGGGGEGATSLGRFETYPGSGPKATEVLDYIQINKKKSGPVSMHGMDQVEQMSQVDIDGINFRWNDTSEDQRAATAITIASLLTGEPLPNGLTKHTRTIVLTEQENTDDRFWADVYGIANLRSLASAGGQDGSIVIYRGRSATREIIVHEMGHNLAFARYGDIDPRSRRSGDASDWAKITKEKAPTEYARKAGHIEDFADSVQLYVNRKQDFTRRYPQRARIIRRLLAEKEQNYEG